MGISFSAHISNKSSAITGRSKLASVAKHNLRLYKTEIPRERCYEILKGTDELYTDVTNLYHELFDDALKEYNDNQTRENRKIPDYFDAVCKKSQDIAVEMIVQIGDMRFWEEQKEWDHEWKERSRLIYSELLPKLEELMPDFKIANAVIHYDEASPHMHIVGVPIRTNCTKGLKTQVSKRTVFTKDTLANLLQGEFRDYANTLVKAVYEGELAVKKVGRNHDLTVTQYKVQQESKKLKDLEMKAAEAEIKAAESEKLAAKAVAEVMEIKADHDRINDEINEFHTNIYKMLPEPKTMMSAKTYKEKYVMPFLDKVYRLVAKALGAFQNLYLKFRSLQKEHAKMREYFDTAREANADLRRENERLEERSDTLYSIENYLGDDKYASLLEEAERHEEIIEDKRRVKVR